MTELDAWEILRTESPRDREFTESSILAKWDSARRSVGAKARAVPENPSSGGFFIPTPGAVGGVIDPSAFFSKADGLNANLLAQAVLDIGPLAIEDAEDRSIWCYRGGVWKYAPNEVLDRCTILLGHKFRPNHVGTIRPIVNRVLSEQGAIITSEPLPEYINCRNGMLHWSTGTLYPHDPSFYSTVQLPVEWDPAAIAPSFDVFVKQVMAEDAVAYFWEVLGYMVYSGNPLQRAFLFHGNGSNGKGTVIRVLTGILGPNNCSAVTLADIAEGKFEVASMVGKIANLAGDIDASYMKSTAKLKAITGEDTIEAQRKFQNPFRFKCWATPLFSANEFWKSVDTSQGYFRRWQIVSFPHTFQVTPGLSESFDREYPGILTKAVEALRELMGRGYFAEPESARVEKQRFEHAADQVLEWLTDDALVVVCDPTRQDVRATVPDAYRYYRNWCEATGSQAVSAQKFKQRLLQAGYVIKKSNGYWRVQGLVVSLQQAPRSGVSDYDDEDES
jgi:P4 family phage/plasmid primase-like protien